MEGITKAEFADAVSTAIRSVRHFYREVDRLVSHLKEALLDGESPLVVVRGSKAEEPSGKRKGGVVVPDEFALLMGPLRDDEMAGDVGDEDDEVGEEDDVIEAAQERTARRMLDPEQPFLALRLSLATPNPIAGFEPALQYAVLGEWEVSGAKPSDEVPIRAYMLRRIPVSLGKVIDDSRRVATAAIADIKGRRGADRRISFKILGGVQTVPLYDLDDPKALDELAVKMKDHWRAVTANLEERA